MRSALRKIYEKDDVPSKCLILVVADIKQMDKSSIYLELSDGWYSIGCKVDESFSKCKIGDKLITFGAELMNHDQACSPLEAPSPHPEQTKLKIHFNSTRRARYPVIILGFSYKAVVVFLCLGTQKFPIFGSLRSFEILDFLYWLKK